MSLKCLDCDVKTKIILNDDDIFLKYAQDPPPMEHNHANNIRKRYAQNQQYSAEILNAQKEIKIKIDNGIAVIKAVEDVIMTLPLSVFCEFPKKRFYNTAYAYFSRNHKVEELVKTSQGFQKFDDIREALNCARNDSVRQATRHASEPPSSILIDEQIDQNFVILQTSEQRDVMIASNILLVDQNDKCTPVGACRTLTIMSVYHRHPIATAEVITRDKSKKTHKEVATRIKILCEKQSDEFTDGPVLFFIGNRFIRKKYKFAWRHFCL